MEQSPPFVPVGESDRLARDVGEFVFYAGHFDVSVATSWVGEGHVDAFGPELIYGFVVLMSNVSYLLLVVTLRHVNGPTSALVKLYGQQHDWKAVGSIVMAFIAMILALLWPPLTIILDLLMLLLWAIPDQRVERHLLRGPKE